MARPSIYTEDIVAKAEDYLTEYDHDGDVVPTLAGLADFIGVCRDTVYDWISQDDKAEFSYITKRVMSMQERKLVNKGLSGEFNPVVTKMLLGKHGYSEKITQDISVTSHDDWVEKLE